MFVRLETVQVLIHRAQNYQGVNPFVVSNQSYNVTFSLSKKVLRHRSQVELNDGSVDSVVDDVEAKLWAELHGFPYCETSACTGQGVADMFQLKCCSHDDPKIERFL